MSLVKNDSTYPPCHSCESRNLDPLVLFPKNLDSKAYTGMTEKNNYSPDSNMAH